MRKIKKFFLLFLGGCFISIILARGNDPLSQKPINKETDTAKVTAETTAVKESLEVLPLPPPQTSRLEKLRLKRVEINNAFGVKERLEFSVSWGFITAGSAVMEVTELTKLGPNKCYHIVSTAKSNKFFSTFFKVEDRVESYMDIYSLFPWKFEKHLREGGFRAERLVIFDQEKNLAYEGKDTIKVPPYVQDILSTFYYVRTQDLKVGNSLFVENYADRKNYSLEVKVLRKERVKVEAGTFDCLVVEPILKSVGLFQQKGKLTVWLTDDERKMPVLMKSKVAIGSVATELKKYTLGEAGKF